MRDGCPFCDYDGPSSILERHTYRIDPPGGRDRTDVFFIIEPLNPVTVGHVLVIVECLDGECDHEVIGDFRLRPGLLGRAMEVAAGYADRSRVASGAMGVEEGCNLIVSAGAAATQTVQHLHIHVIPRTEGDGLLLPWSQPH